MAGITSLTLKFNSLAWQLQKGEWESIVPPELMPSNPYPANTDVFPVAASLFGWREAKIGNTSGSTGYATSFPGFSHTRPYGARERETLVGSGHVVPEQN